MSIYFYSQNNQTHTIQLKNAQILRFVDSMEFQYPTDFRLDFKLCNISKLFIILFENEQMKLLKIYVLGAVFLTFFCCLTTHIDENYNYDTFMMQFGRNYTGEEKDVHEKIFNKNYAELISLIKQGHDVEVNNLLDWTEEQKQAFMNYRPEKLNIPRSEKPLKSTLNAASLPSYDWRSYNRVTPVKDQKSCGSCWAFASTAQYESLLMMGTNGTTYDLAEQYALECDKSSSGCNGGNPYSALGLIKSTGIPLESSYPYQYQSDSYYKSQSKPICSDTSRIKLTQSVISLKYYSNLSEEQLQQYLIDYGPLTVGIDASSMQFHSAGASGVVSCPASKSPTYLNHAVLLVGYNTTHWFIKNSWSTQWGNHGFGYIDKKHDCNLHVEANVMNVNFTNSVNPPSPTPTPGPNPPNPSPTPIPTGQTALIITMSSRSGNGWGGNILGFKQNNVVVATFGSNFTYGASSDSFQITIKSNVTTQIVVVQRGNFTSDIGFTIKYSNGNIVYQRNPGSTFATNTIFTTFCPGNGCPSDSTTITYYLTMTDTYGDGWGGNILGFRQNGVIQNFTMQSGRTSGPKPFQFQKYVNVDIVVSRIASYTTEVGFEVRASNGLLVFSRKPGSKFAANSILGNFCPECVNLSPVQDVGNTEVRQPAPPLTFQNDVEKNSYKAATIVFGCLSIILMATVVFLAIKVIKIRREMRSKNNLNLAPNRVNPTLEDISSAKSQQVFVQ